MHEFDLSDPDQRNQMAGEYVLGTLEREDKARFEALLMVSHDAQREVEQWREHLDVLNDSLTPVAPPQQLWKSIDQATRPKKSFSLWSWQPLTAFSLVVLLAVGMIFQPFSQPENVYVYLIKDEQQDPGWVMNASFKEDMLTIKCLKEVEMPDNTFYEAWLMIDGKEPVTLGFLPGEEEGTRTMKLKPEWKKHLMDSEIVVTMEGPDGAPSGYQMGPLSDRAEWKRIQF